MKKKKCSACAKTRLIKLFSKNKNKNKKDGLQTLCKECSKDNFKKYYRANRKKQIKVVGVRKRNVINSVRQFIYDYLKCHSCVDCNESDPIVLEFDHVRDKKRNNLSNMIGNGCSLASVLKEVAKCEVRCANCHRRKTAKDQDWYCNINTGL